MSDFIDKFEKAFGKKCPICQSDLIKSSVAKFHCNLKCHRNDFLFDKDQDAARSNFYFENMIIHVAVFDDIEPCIETYDVDYSNRFFSYLTNEHLGKILSLIGDSKKLQYFFEKFIILQ